jgi:alpha-tubulin suppressor-like RCC1 family protein
MSNLDVLEIALSKIRNNLKSFCNVVADIDNDLINAETYLLDNPLNSIFSNIDNFSIFKSYSNSLQQTITEPIKLEDISLKVIRPRLHTPYDPIQTCNVEITPITFTNFNKYFTSILDDTLVFYVTDLEIQLNSLNFDVPFITTGSVITNYSNFKITNDFFIIQPDFRNKTIDINIRALYSYNLQKYEEEYNVNYLSDPYTISIIEQSVPSIIKISPNGSNDTIIIQYTDYIRNNLNTPIIFLKTFISTTISTIENITSIYYAYELPTDKVVFSNVDQEYLSNFNNEYYYTFDFRGSNNEFNNTTIQIEIYDLLYYPNYTTAKIITNVIIQEPSPIILINGTSNNYIETIEGYNTFVINYSDIFSNNVNQSQTNINYGFSIDTSINTNRFYTDVSHIKHNVIDFSDTNIKINTDYRNTNYKVVIIAKEENYQDLPTFYTINITELQPPHPIITQDINLIFGHSTTPTSNVNLYNYFTSGTSNLILEFSLEPDITYQTDDYANLFSITGDTLTITQNKYFNVSRTLKTTINAVDTVYLMSNSIELTFNQEPLIDIIVPIVTLNDISTQKLITITDYLNFNLSDVESNITTTITFRNVPDPIGHEIPLITENINSNFKINPDYRTAEYTLIVNVKPTDQLYSTFDFSFNIIIQEKQLLPPYLIDSADNARNYTLSNNNLRIDLNDVFCNTITDFNLAYLVDPINDNHYIIADNIIIFEPDYRDFEYDIEIKASNIEYNIESSDTLKINIIEENPIRSLKDFVDITSTTQEVFLLDEYFESKDEEHIDNINFYIKYLDLAKNEITVRSNICNTENPSKIETNQLIIIPDFRNDTYLIEIEARHSIYTEANLIKTVQVIEGIKPNIDTVIRNYRIEQDYFTLELSNYFDLRYYLSYGNKVQLQFEYEVEYKSNVEIKLFYEDSTLYYSDHFGNRTSNVFSIAYTNIVYIIHTNNVLILYENSIEIIRSTNNILRYTSRKESTIYDSVSSSTPLFEIKNRNIRNYIDDPNLIVNDYIGKSIITDNINLSNLSYNTAPFIIIVNIYNILSDNPSKLNIYSLKLNIPKLSSKVVTDQRHIQSTYNIIELINSELSFDTTKYDFNFSTLTDSNLYCNLIVELSNNNIIANPYYRNESYLVYIDAYDTDNEVISDILLYKFTELSVLERKPYTESYIFTSNQYIFDYSNFITNNAIECNLELTITVLSNATYIPIDEYNIRTTIDGNKFYSIDDVNKILTINPDFRNATYELDLFFDVTNIDKTDISKAINCNLIIKLQINEEKIPSIQYNSELLNFDITNNISDQIFDDLKTLYNYKYLDNINFEVIFQTFINEDIRILNKSLYLKFDYHNCNYDVTIKASDVYYLPYESNIELVLNINEQQTIEDISSSYDFAQFSNITNTNIIINMTDLFCNLTHYDTQIFDISLFNNKYDNKLIYYNVANNLLTITPNSRGEEYYITIESYIHGSQHYQDQKLSKTFNIIELPVINIKSHSITNPLYFSNIYDVYSCNYPFYNNLEIKQSISKIDKYIDNSKYIPDIIQYNVSDTINTTSYTYVEDKRGVEYNVSFDINVIDFENETLNSNFNFSVIEELPIEYISGSNQTIAEYSDIINIGINFRNNTSSNLIINFIGAYEITSNIGYNEVTNYISKYLSNTYSFSLDEQDTSLDQPNILTNVYNPQDTEITKVINNVVFGFWCKELFDINLSINEITQNINYSASNWFYVLIVYISNTNSIRIYNNMNIVSNITNVVTSSDVATYTIIFNSSNLVSKLSFFTNMDERTHKALVNNVKIDLPFNADNSFRIGKELTLAFDYNQHTTDLDIILANSGKKYELLFNAYINNYENFKKLEYSVFVEEKPLVIPIGGLSADKHYTRSMSIEITDGTLFDTEEKIETTRQHMIKSLVLEMFSKDTTIDPTALEESLTKSIVLEVVNDELVITVNPDISQSITTDEYIADLQSIIISDGQTTESLEIVSQVIILENIDYTALTPEDKAIIIGKTKAQIKNTNSDLISENAIIVTLAGNGDKVIVSVAIKVTTETAQSVKEGLESDPVDPDASERTLNLAEKIMKEVILEKAGDAPDIPEPSTTVPEPIKDTILKITLNNIIYIEADKSIFKNIIIEELLFPDRTIETQITPTEDNYVNIVISIKTPTETEPTDIPNVIELSKRIKNKYLSSKSSIIKVPNVFAFETINIIVSIAISKTNKYKLDGIDSTLKEFISETSYGPSNVKTIQILKGVKLNLRINTSSDHPFIIVKSRIHDTTDTNRYNTGVTYSTDTGEYEENEGQIDGNIIWDTSNSDVGTYYGICVNHSNMYFIIDLVTTIKQKAIKTITSFDIILNGLNFDDLTKNDKETLIKLTKTKSESSNGDKTIKDIKILTASDQEGNAVVIIKIIYETDLIDSQITEPVAPTQADIEAIISDFKDKKNNIEDILSSISNLIIESPTISENKVDTIIKINEIVDGDLDKESIIEVIKYQLSKKTREPQENIEIYIQYIDEVGEEYIEIKTIISTSNMDEIADIMLNHPSLKSNIMNEIKNREKSYSNSPEDITGSMSEFKSDRSVTDLELTLPYIDTQNKENQELIKTKINEQFSEIPAEDITITFDSVTYKVSVSIRQDEDIEISDLDSEILQNNIINTELKEQNVLEEQSTFLTEPTVEDSEIKSKETISFEFSVLLDDKDYVNIEIIKNKVNKDIGIDTKDIVIEVSEDGKVVVEISYISESTPPTTDDLKNSISDAISTSIIDTKLGFISDGSFFSEATTQESPQSPQQTSTGLDKDIVEFNLKISSVDYSEMNDTSLDSFRNEIKNILLSELDETTIELLLKNIVFTSGSLKITIKIELASTAKAVGKTLETDVLTKLNEILSGSYKTRKQQIADIILNKFNTNPNLANKLELGKIAEDIEIELDSTSIIRTSSNRSQITSSISFTNIDFDIITEEQSIEIKTKTKNIIHNAIESSSANVILLTTNNPLIGNVNITVSSNKGVFSIEAIKIALDELSETIQTSIRKIIIEQTSQEPGAVTTVNDVIKNDVVSLSGFGDISSSDELIYNLGDIYLVDYSNIINVSDYIELTELEYEIIIGSEYIVSIENNQFIVINNNNNYTHLIEIHGSKLSPNIKIIIIFTIVESDETAINLSGDSNFNHYPLIFEQTYLLTDLYNYYRKDYINYYICNLDHPTLNVSINADKELVITPEDNISQYSFTIKAEDTFELFSNEDITFYIKNVSNLAQNGEIISATIESNLEIKDVPLTIDFLDLYTLNKEDSNILSVRYITSGITPVFGIVQSASFQENQAQINNNINITYPDMVLTIDPINIKINYRIQLYVAYKDLSTNNEINRFNSNITYYIQETGVFSFTDDSGLFNPTIKYIPKYGSITLSNNEETYSLIDGFTLHYTSTLNINDDIRFSNINPPDIAEANYKDDIYSNAYIVDMDQKTITFSGEYRVGTYDIYIQAYFEGYPSVILTTIYGVKEDQLPQLKLNSGEENRYEYINQSNETIYLPTILSRYNYENYPYIDELVITYKFDPLTDIPYICNLTNDTLSIQTNYRGDMYRVIVTLADPYFNIFKDNEYSPGIKINDEIKIRITEYAPLKFNEGFNSNIVIDNLSNNTIIHNIFNDITVYATHCNLIFSNSYLSNCVDADFGHYNLLKLFSNPIDSPTDPYDQVDSNIYNISFNPEYRDKTYAIGYNIYMSGYESQYIEVKFILTEINIPEINKLESIQTTISKNYTSNIPDIINLSDLYDYPYSNELKFNITSTSNYTYDNNNILTFTPDFRNEEYSLNIEAYDPYFTNQTRQNSSNNVINYNITEKPPLEFDGIPLQNQRYIEHNLGREEKHFNIIDNVRIYATHCNIIINNMTTLDSSVRTAYYNETYPNAITIINDSNLIIASEHRGINYENTFDIYISGYNAQKITKTYDISELSIQNISITDNNIGYSSSIQERKQFILKDLYYEYLYFDKLIFSIIDSKQKLKTADTFENNIGDAIIYGLSNISNQCNLFIDLEIDEQEFEFTIKAEDSRFGLVNDSLKITITKDTPLDFNVPEFTNQSIVTENITNMSNSIITIDFFDKYVLNIDEGNILVIAPMYPYNPNINGRLAYYPDNYPTYNEDKPYKIIDSNVYFLPEYRGIEYSNIFKLYASNIETNISYSTYYLQVNCICSENIITDIIFRNNEDIISTLSPIQFDSIIEESYDLSTLYEYPYLDYLYFDYTVDQDIPYSNTVMEQSNLTIILKPKLRGKNYTITINAYDNYFQISNLELAVDINEIPAIKFKNEDQYADSYFNRKIITINDLTNTQIICNLESYIDNNSGATILFSNIFPSITEVRNAHYDTTTNKNALRRIDTTITEANICNITTDTIELHNGKNSYKVNENILENINLIDGKEFSVAFNFYFTGVFTETEYFSINGVDDDTRIRQTLLKCKIDTDNNIKFETPTYATIEDTIDTTPGWNYIVFNFKEDEGQLYINKELLTSNTRINNDLTNIQITINSNIEYFQSFRVIDKPLTENDIDYLFTNQINTLFYEKNSLYINPEYRDIPYIAQVVLTTEGYEEISRTLEFYITECNIQSIDLIDDIETEFSNLSNNVVVITNLRDKYDYIYSNELQLSIVNSSLLGVNLRDDTLTITPELRNSAYNIIIKAEELNIKNNGNDLSNSELIFNIHEIFSIKFKDSYIDSDYYRFDISQPQYSIYNNYTFNQNDLTTYMFVKGLDECNIILNVKESSSFKRYSLNASSNELTIVFDYDYYYECNIDFEAYLENYPDTPLETTIRVIIPQLEPPILTNTQQYYNLIGERYIDSITHKIEFPNIFKNEEDIENLTINITSIGDDITEFNYDGNMIYSYIKPSENFYRQNNNTDPNITLIDSIEFSNFNNNSNKIGPYYQVDGNEYNVIYAFKHNSVEYNIKFEEKYHNCILEVLVVGGGGGGRSGNTTMVGNGGSGGQVIYSNITIDSNKTYNITVGDGGNSDSAGGESSFDNIIAIGGAGGTNEIEQDILYVNNVRTFTEFNFKVEGIGYSNVEEKIFNNLGCNFYSTIPSIGAGLTTEDPSIGKYEENSSNFYDIYKNITIGDYSDSKIYLGGGGKFGYGYDVKTLSRNTYSCGDNYYGQLGRVVDNNDTIPSQITGNIGDSNIVAISVGYNHSLFLDEDRKVYSCGQNSYGELGHGNRNDYDLPTKIDALNGSNIVAISAGAYHSLFLDNLGNVYSCGDTEFGKLGRVVDNNTIPSQITETIDGSNIVAISAGASHSLFLDDLGNVYSCGYGSSGELGHENEYDCNLPTKIDTLNGSNIVAISGGEAHSLFLDDLGNVYSCGYGGSGQLGHENEYDCNLPTKIDALNGSNIVAISAGAYHSLFLDNLGNVYSCGDNIGGQLGRVVDNNTIPVQITANISDSYIVAISAGGGNGGHSLFLDDLGNVYSCGNNTGGRLGRIVTDYDNTIPVQITANISDSYIVAISAGSYHSLFISADVVTETELPSTASLGGGGNAVQYGSSPGKSLSGGGGSGGAIGNYLGGKGGSGLVLLKYNTGLKYYPDEYYCNLSPVYQELTVSAENIFGQTTVNLRFIRLGYTTLTVPDLTNDKVSNIYLFEEVVSYDVGRTFSIEYNPIESGCNLEIDNCNLIIRDDYRGIYDTIINLGDNIYNIFRINEREDNTGANTYSL